MAPPGRAAGQDLRDRRPPRLAGARGAAASTTTRRSRTSRRSGSRATSPASAAAYQVVPELRQMIVFAQHNVIRDAPFTRVDLVTCRNLLIYLQPAAQQKVLSLFHFALQPGRRAVPRPEREPGHARPRLRDARQALAALPQARRGRARPSTPAAPRAGPGGAAVAPMALAQRGAARTRWPSCSAPTTRCSTRSCRRACWSSERGELVHAFGGASRFLRLRDGRLGPATCSTWSTPS